MAFPASLQRIGPKPKYRRCLGPPVVAQPHSDYITWTGGKGKSYIHSLKSSASLGSASQFVFSFVAIYTMSEHWRMQFNNYVQRNNLGPYVAWPQAVQTGPQNAPTWTAFVYIDGVEYGRGSAVSLGGARELAAEMALRALWSSRGYS